MPIQAHHRSPEAAAKQFRRTITDVLRCITEAYVDISEQEAASGEITALTLGGGLPVRLDLPTPHSRLSLSVTINYRVISETAGWRVHTEKYFYTLDDGTNEIIAFHWDPTNVEVRYPHLHLAYASGVQHPVLQTAHIPTGRVLIEDVIWLTIREFQVECLNRDAEHNHRVCRRRLRTARKIFGELQSWGATAGDVL